MENAKIWSDQVGSMAQAWMDAQKSIWEKWFEVLQTTPSASPGRQESTGQWEKLTQEAFESWTASAGATANATAQKLLAGQESWMRVLELTSQAWKAIAANVETGDDWQHALSRYMDGVRQQLAQSPEKLLNSTEKMGELWQLYMAEFQKLAQPWVAGWQQAQSPFGSTAGDSSALAELSRLYWNTFDQTFGRLLQSPGLGSSRELNDKFAKGFAAWRELSEASAEYQIILAKAAARVMEQSLKESVAMAERGETIQSVRQWVLPIEKVADPVLTEVFGSDEFVRVQGRLLNAAMTHWICRREIVEEFLKVGDLPTRNEIDEIHRTLYEQRKEIKALRKVLTECISVMQKMSMSIGEQKNQSAVANGNFDGANSQANTSGNPSPSNEPPSN